MDILINREDFERAVPAFRSPTPEVWNKVQRYVEGCTANWQAIIATDATLPDRVAGYLATAICLRAAYDAVPQMDLVLTPTGFGIVSNQNTAPASRERVDALRLQLRRDACQLEDHVLLYLAAHNMMTLRRSRAGSLLWTPSLCTLYGIRTPEGGEVLREEFDTMATALHAASARVVDVISPELYAALVTRQYAADAERVHDPSPKEEVYGAALLMARQLMAAHVMQGRGIADHTRHLINYIEAHADQLDEYRLSPTYQARHTTQYENKQTDPSFFFG
nr:MAG TPA: hypothetical protein [Caudoviricetes sp.]